LNAYILVRTALLVFVILLHAGYMCLFDDLLAKKLHIIFNERRK